MGLCGKKGVEQDSQGRPIKPYVYKRPKIDLKLINVEQMQAIPNSFEDLIDVAVFCNMKDKIIVDEMINPDDFKQDAFRQIYIGNEEAAIESIGALQRISKWEQGFQFDLLISFWLGVHCGRKKVLNHVMQYDIYLRQLVTLALRNKPQQRPDYYPQQEEDLDNTFYAKQIECGVTSENAYLAGMGPKPSDPTPDINSFSDELEPEALLQSERPTLNKLASEVPVEFFSDQRDENVDNENKFGSVLPMHTILKSNNEIGSQFHDNLYQGSKNFEGGEHEEFDEMQGQPSENEADQDQADDVDKHHSSDEDIGEGEGDSDLDGANSDKDFKSHRSDISMDLDCIFGFLDPDTVAKKIPLDSDSEKDEEEEAIQSGKYYHEKPTVKMAEDELHQRYLREMGMTGQEIEICSLETEEDLQILKKHLRLNFPSLMAKIVEILLYRQEEKLACLLTAYYELNLEEDNFKTAVEQQHFDWLSYVWTFGKNCCGYRNLEGSRSKVILKQLIEMIASAYTTEDESQECCRVICKWYLLGDQDEHNLLWALLSTYQELLTIEYMGYYDRFLTKGLFLYALSNNNTEFMKLALNMKAFDDIMLREDMVVAKMLESFEHDGSKTNFILNVFLLTDISLWRPNFIDCLLGLFDQYLEGNQLLLSYNPLMSIALTCDLVVRIGNSRKMFKDQCNDQLENLLSLGEIYSTKIEDDDYYNQLIEELDFTGRSVLNIICYSKFQPLMSEDDPKAANKIRNIWHGEKSTKCDGNILGFSNMTSIVLTAPKIALDDDSFFSIVSGKFNVQNVLVDYTMQFTYRKMAISQYFIKEILFAAIMIFMFRYVNEAYRTLFKAPFKYVQQDAKDGSWIFTENPGLYDFDNIIPQPQTREVTERIEQIKESLDEFASWYLLVFFLSGSLLYSTALKIFFNVKANTGVNNRVPYDRWTKLDTVSALLTIIGFPFIVNLVPEHFVVRSSKDLVDMLMLAIITLQWTRFLQFFLMLSELSKMILTFITMLIDTQAFMFLVGSYLIVMAAVFTTVFQDVNPVVYGTFTISLRSTFDGLMGSYGYKGFGESEMLHMTMMWFHIFMSNILLLNYLVAILSQSYSDMLDKGKFLYKVYLYQYCERYMVSLDNRQYGQLVIHPAPLVVLNFPLFIVTLLASIPKMPDSFAITFLSRTSYVFAILMFWLENIVWIGMFLLYEAMLSPFVYFKNLFVVAWATQGLFQTIWNTIAWLFAGPFYIIFFILRDACYLFHIFTMHDGCRANSGEVDELQVNEPDTADVVRAYNEARDIVIEKYHDAVKQAKEKSGDQEQQNQEDEDKPKNVKILDMIEEDSELIEQYRQDFFIIPASSLTDAWKKEQSVRMKANLDKEKEEQEKNKEETEEEKRKKLDEDQAKAKNNASKQGQLENLFVKKKGGQSHSVITSLIQNVINADANEDEIEEEEKNDEPEAEIELEPEQLQEEIVNEFYKKFVINSDGSTASDTVDITLLMQAIPTPVLSLNIDQIKLFNLIILQDAIVAHENAETVTSFEFYDKKNKKRVADVKEIVNNQFNNLKKVEGNLKALKEKLSDHKILLSEYEQKMEEWKQTRETVKSDAVLSLTDQISKKQGQTEKQDNATNKAGKAQKAKKGKKGKGNN